jgi:Zn finger protein HypA/HybF involved in hydrogenase expression
LEYPFLREQGENIMSDEIDMLCEKCGQTFSAFLHEMADKNAKLLCPKCRESRDCNSPKAAEPVTGTRSIGRIS